MRLLGGYPPGPPREPSPPVSPSPPYRGTGQALRAYKGEGERRTEAEVGAEAPTSASSSVLGRRDPAPDSSRGIGMTVAFSLVLGGGGWHCFGDMQVLAWVAGRVPTRDTPPHSALETLRLRSGRAEPHTGDGFAQSPDCSRVCFCRGQAGVGNEGLRVGLVDSAWGWNYHLDSPGVSLWRSGPGG